MSNATITVLGIEGRKDKVFRRIFHIRTNAEVRKTVHYIGDVAQPNHFVVMLQTNGNFHKQVVAGSRIIRKEVERISPHWKNLGGLTA